MSTQDVPFDGGVATYDFDTFTITRRDLDGQLIDTVSMPERMRSIPQESAAARAASEAADAERAAAETLAADIAADLASTVEALRAFVELDDAEKPAAYAATYPSVRAALEAYNDLPVTSRTEAMTADYQRATARVLEITLGAAVGTP